MSSTRSRELVVGGRFDHVVRVGNTVRRRTGPWTPSVHALLAHLAAAGFHGAPRAHGVDGNSREILDFIPGQVPRVPESASAVTDEALAALGRLVREYHDASSTFAPPAGARWYLPSRSPAEVICHGDLGPYNCVFRDGLPVALIDFDAAHPGPRCWDLGWTAISSVPLQPPTRASRGEEVLARQRRRLRILCDAYALEAADRRAVVEGAVARAEHLADHIEAQAAQRPDAFDQAAFAASRAADEPAWFRAVGAYIAANAEALESALVT